MLWGRHEAMYCYVLNHLFSRSPFKDKLFPRRKTDWSATLIYLSQPTLNVNIGRSSFESWESFEPSK